MSSWREVQETLYQRFAAVWADRTPFQLANEDGFDPPNARWAKVDVLSAPGLQGSLGGVGNRRFDRAGRVFIRLREPPGNGVGSLSDLAGEARDIFEGCRFIPHDIRFAEGDIGNEATVDDGRWWGVTVECRFDYEDIK